MLHEPLVFSLRCVRKVVNLQFHIGHSSHLMSSGAGELVSYLIRAPCWVNNCTDLASVPGFDHFQETCFVVRLFLVDLIQ